MTATITNGTISCGRTIKTGEYENKRFDVQLSFTVPEGGDTADCISTVGEMAMRQMNSMIGAREIQADTRNDATPKEAITSKVLKAPKKAAPKADAAEMEEYDRPEPPKKAVASAADVEEVPALLKREVAAQNAQAAEETIDDLLGGDAPAVKEITDTELFDAANKKMTETKNGVAIRKILSEVGIKQPSGRIIDIPQDKRQLFLDKLKDIKPLA